MQMEKIVSCRAGDHYYKIKHSSGLLILLYPKEHCSTTYAVFGTKYGSIDSCFRRSDEEHPETVPEGIAHYLEHKLFESEDGDAFERYARTGANANAFTSFESTCYLFSCADHLYDSLEILLDFVQSPYFTEQSVAKEQGIIGQEIKMYDDDPQWQVMFQYLRAMYQKHPIRQDIAGTVESIAKITPEHLYRYYRTFYNLNNMALCIAGNLEVEKVLELCDRMLKPSAPVMVERVFEEEPQEVLLSKTEKQLSVACPLFQFGYKEAVETGSLRSERELAVMSVLLEMMASDSSPLFRRLLDAELINEASFGYEYFEGAGFGTVLFGGESKDPQAVAAMIEEEVCRLKREGLDHAAFLRAKKSVYGENISALNSTGSIANALAGFTFKGRELFSYLDALAELELSEVQKALNRVFQTERTVLSVVRPIS